MFVLVFWDGPIVTYPLYMHVFLVVLRILTAKIN